MPDGSSHNPPHKVPFRERLTCSVEEAAAATGLSERSIWRRVKSGVLASRIPAGSRRRLISIASLILLVEGEP